MDTIINLLQNILEFIENSGLIGSLLSCGLIFVESIIPVLPLMVFITINFLVLGKVLGFILSWIFTVLGCVMSYMIFKNGFGDRFENLTKDKQLINKYKKMFKNISLGKLIIIIAIPFTPAFVVNIVAGLVKMDFKKYLIALLIGKLSLIYFWGFVGTSLVESIQNPIQLLKMFVIVLVTYLIYLVLNKVLKLN